MNTNQLIATISVDLKRIALAYHSNSLTTGKKFISEVLNAKKYINSDTIEPYMEKILLKLDTVLINDNNIELAEDALMYSTILQNYYVSRLASS